MNIHSKTETANTAFQVFTIAVLGLMTLAEFATLVASNIA